MTLPVMTPACFNTGKSMSFFFQYIAVLNRIHLFSVEKAPKHFAVRNPGPKTIHYVYYVIFMFCTILVVMETQLVRCFLLL